MDSNDEQLVRATERLDLNDDLVEVQYAYHVTNVKVEYDEHGNDINKPTWNQLRWNLADDPTFDGSVLFGAPCVFFATTLYKTKLPDKTMYPRGGEQHAYYWRVKVPLTYFNNYEILFLHEQPTQKRLLLVKKEEAEKIPRTKIESSKADKYLRRDDSDPNNVKYYSNEHTKTKYFVCIAVCEDVNLDTPGVDWDKVRREFDMDGLPKREKLRKMLFDKVIDELKK